MKHSLVALYSSSERLCLQDHLSETLKLAEYIMSDVDIV